EFEAVETVEARCAKDADKLEMLLQAVEYRDVGVAQVDRWIESARKDLRTATARRVAEVAVTMPSLSWRGACSRRVVAPFSPSRCGRTAALPAFRGDRFTRFVARVT